MVRGKEQLKDFKHGDRCQSWKAEMKVWDSLVEVAVENVIPPPAITDPTEISEYRNSLVAGEIKASLALTYPGVVQQIRDYASSVATTPLKHIPTPSALAAFRRYLQNQQKLKNNERKMTVNQFAFHFFK